MDWLQRHLLAVAATVSPTRLRFSKRQRNGRRARSAPTHTTVDIDQKMILLARSSSSSCSTDHGSGSAMLFSHSTDVPSATSMAMSNGAPKQCSMVTFAADSSDGSQLYIEDRDDALIALGFGIPDETAKPVQNGDAGCSSRSRLASRNGHLRHQCVVNRAFQDSSPLPIRRHPQLIAWPPVPVPLSSATSPSSRHRSHSPPSLNQPAATSSASVSPRRLNKLLAAVVPPLPPSFSLHNAARHFLLPYRSHLRRYHQQQHSAASGATVAGGAGDYIRVPEELPEQDEVVEQRVKGRQRAQLQPQSSTSSSRQQQQRVQRRVLPQRRLRGVRPTNPHTASSSLFSHRPISSACPLQNIDLVETMRPYKLDVVLHMPELCPEELERHTWNPEDRSMNLYVKEEERLTMHRHPVAQSTDCIRGKIGYTRGFHVWQLNWPTHQRGTHAVVGVATKDLSLHAPGYMSLIGLNAEGFGWNIVEKKCYHDADNTKAWAYPVEQQACEEVPEKLFCILDMDEGQMAFATEFKYLGVAFRGLKGKKLYPAVSAVWGHAEITLKYMGGLDPEPRQLMDICRRAIRVRIGKSRIDRIGELDLPPNLTQYLQYK